MVILGIRMRTSAGPSYISIKILKKVKSQCKTKYGKIINSVPLFIFYPFSASTCSCYPGNLGEPF